MRGSGHAYTSTSVAHSLTPALLQTDYLGNMIRYIDISSRKVTQILGSSAQTNGFADGVGTQTMFSLPQGVAMNAAGTIVFVVGGEGSA